MGFYISTAILWSHNIVLWRGMYLFHIIWKSLNFYYESNIGKPVRSLIIIFVIMSLYINLVVICNIAEFTGEITLKLIRSIVNPLSCLLWYFLLLYSTFIKGPSYYNLNYFLTLSTTLPKLYHITFGWKSVGWRTWL